MFQFSSEPILSSIIIVSLIFQLHCGLRSSLKLVTLLLFYRLYLFLYANENQVLFLNHCFLYSVVILSLFFAQVQFLVVLSVGGRVVYKQRTPLFFVCLKMPLFCSHSFESQFHWADDSRLTVILLRTLSMFSPLISGTYFRDDKPVVSLIVVYLKVNSHFFQLALLSLFQIL